MKLALAVAKNSTASTEMFNTSKIAPPKKLPLRHRLRLEVSILLAFARMLRLLCLLLDKDQGSCALLHAIPQFEQLVAKR